MKRSATLLILGFTLLSLSSFIPQQIIKTQITITVRDELGNTVEGATVKLFEKENDYLKEVNAAAEGETDKKGTVRFKELKAIPYFILARKEDKDNAGGGEQIGKLGENRINKATVIIQ
jgi:hypothetical protein